MTAAGTAIRCPGCGAFFSNVGELVEAGGQLRSVGLALKARCPKCAHEWGINSAWRKRETTIKLQES